MDRAIFDQSVDIVSQSQTWREIGDTLRNLWFQTAAKLPDERVLGLALSFADTPGQKPADFFKELKAEYRRYLAESQQQEQVEVNNRCDEAIKFRRLQGFLGQPRSCPYDGCGRTAKGEPHCYCWEEIWNQPVTDAERAGVTDTNPMLEVYGALPARDPKERDLVWVDD